MLKKSLKEQDWCKIEKSKQLNYKDAGVDIKKGNQFIKEIMPFVNKTKTKGVVSSIGSFGGLFGIDAKKYKDPVLVSSTDGVGTKLLIAQRLNTHKWVGYDLVGMCVNDVATTGARPLFFLDYISTGKIKLSILKSVVKSITLACKESGYALIGGETAEMPGMYKPGEYDLAGFCVGIIDKKDIIDGSSIKKGDILIGLESNGAHSNGYSLIRKVFSKKELLKYKNQILRPTKLYTKPLLNLGKKIKLKGIAHVTGGAYFEKIPRIIPKGLGVVIDTKSWVIPDIFKKIQIKGNVKRDEMFKVFNMGIGMVVAVSKKDVQKAKSLLKKQRIKSWIIGSVVKSNKRVELI